MARTVGSFEWKGQERSGNDSQDQSSLPLIGEVPSLSQAEPSFIERATWDGCLRYAIQRSGHDDYEIADSIGISHGYMSKVLKGTAGLWGSRLVKLMRETGSLAPLQWMAHQMGCDIVQKSPMDAEIAFLKAKVARMEREARAA